MKITVKQKGDYSIVTNYLTKLTKGSIDDILLKKYAEKGLQALKDATPEDTGKTKDSWYYRISKEKERISIHFYNSNIVDNVPIAIILQYGHYTGTGGWVEGRDYINPAVKPVFEDIIKEIWKEVTNVK